MFLFEVKMAMADKSTVTYRGIDYYITGCIMRLFCGEWYYQAELHDLKANSVTIAALHDVVPVESRKGNNGRSIADERGRTA